MNTRVKLGMVKRGDGIWGAPESENDCVAQWGKWPPGSSDFSSFLGNVEDNNNV